MAEPTQGFIIGVQLTGAQRQKRNVFPRWWTSEEVLLDTYLVRDRDLYMVPAPYYRLRYRVYATPTRQHASVWRYEKACQTYLEKHEIDGVIIPVSVCDTGQIATDGRKIFALM